MVTRRSVLGFGLGGMALLGVGGLGLALTPGGPQRPTQPLKWMTEREYAFLAAAAEAIAPGAGSMPSPNQVDVASRVDALLARCHPGLSGELRQLFALFENGLGNFAFGLRPRAFSAMSLEERTAVLSEWESSSLSLRRTGFKALKGLVVSCYFSHPSTWAGVGYPGPPEFAPLPPTEAVAPTSHFEGTP